jgi:hypothetical protein
VSKELPDICDLVDSFSRSRRDEVWVCKGAWAHARRTKAQSSLHGVDSVANRKA